ncbi:LST2 protein, partial [Polyodon spathula]|nr:LST2 protein [Polyodon spathula]
PKKSDQRPLAQFYHADEEVTRVTAELNGVDLRKSLQKYLVLLNQLRVSQDRMLRTIELVMEECIAAERQSRDYHIKFPDEILHDNLGVQLWFAAECLSAGSFLEVRESEGVLLRPLAEDLLHCLEELRLLLREHSLSNSHSYPPLVREALLQYDRVFSEFELRYISMVIPVKSAEEMQKQQEIVVLFCETVDRALKLGYVSQELIDGCDPLLMFTIPRLAIICGLLIFPDGPLNLQHGPDSMSSLFSPFYTLLQKIRDLLCILTDEELDILEVNLCMAESGGFLCQQERPPPSTGSGGSPYPNELPPADYDPGEPGKLEAHWAHGAPEPLRDLYTASSTAASSQHREDAAFSPFYPTQEAAREHVIPQNSPPHPAAPGGWDRGFSRGSFPFQTSVFHQSGHQQLQATAEHRHPAEDCRTALGTGERIRSVSELPGSDRDRFYRSCSATVYNRAPARTEAEGRERDSRPLVTTHSGVPGQQLQTAESRYPSRDSSRMRSGQESYRDLVKNRRAAECAQLRARYCSSRDMIHRLFVCISGVADQLQTNFASDMRTILKSVFEVTASSADPCADSAEIELEVEEKDSSVSRQQECKLCEDPDDSNAAGPPVWVPDSSCNRCSACETLFTFLRRRHHCRSCGQIFCARCSPHETSIPRFGQMRAVRVCSHCFTSHIGGETTQL